MPYELRIAFRYLWMARKRAHTAFLSLISTLGLAVGVATLLISLALLSGLQGQIKARLMASSPRLLAEPKGRNTIEGAEDFRRAAHEAGLRSVHALVSGIAMATSEEEGRGMPARIRTFDRESEPVAEETFGKKWEVEAVGPQAFVRRSFAASVGSSLGGDIVIIAPRTRLTPFGPVPVWRRYVVSRILPDTSEERAADVYLPFEEGARLFATSGLPTSIEIYDGPESAEAIQQMLQTKFPALRVKTWQDINRPLFLALRLEKVVMFATISLIILVAALNLVSSISMLIVEKRPQVGILRTLGASERAILIVFLSVGLLIGIFGTALGNVLGLGISWAADRYQLIPLPGDMYYVSHIPFQLDTMDIVGVNAIAILLSVVAALYPARVAAKLDPIIAIRG